MITIQHDFVEVLREQGLRATAQRLFVLGALDELGRATVEQLVVEAAPNMPNLPASTVYRTLETLSARGLVSHTHLGTAKTYQLARHASHAHLVCRGCGDVAELCDEAAAALVDGVARSHGFALDVGHLSIYGRCATCRGPDTPSRGCPPPRSRQLR